MFWTTVTHLSKSMGPFLFLLILAFLKSHSAEGTGCLNGLTSSPASTCVDNRTCVDVACGQHATCVNESGTFKCKCSVGFTYKTSKMDKCEDINECLSGGCPSGDCFNTLGSYYCQCKHGMRFDASGSCVDNRTCVDVACGDNATCVNESGTFKCKCSVGFTYKTSKMDKCEDINECKTGVCPKGDCVNTLGSYYCQCIPGMRYDANGSCVDIDECKADSQICWDYSTCINTNGSYSCHCLPGFHSYRIGQCVDINECVEEKRYCGNEGLCHNLIGSYWCQCSPGSTNYGQNGTKCVELSCDPQEARPGKTLPGLGDLMSLVREKCLSLRNSSTSGTSGPPLGGDVLLKELINATDLVQLSHQINSGPHGSSDVTSFLETFENFIRLIAPQLTEKTARIETNYTEANILVNRNNTQPKGPVSLTSENAQLDTTWETVAGDQNNYPGFAFVSLVSFKNVHILNGNSSQTQQLISNAVIVSTGNPNSTNLNQPVNLTFRHLELADKDPNCVYWSEENGTWSRQGCNLVITNATHTLCSYNHLSTLSLLQGLQQEKGGDHSRVIWMGILVALACVVLSLTTALLCRFASRTRHGRYHLDVKFFRK